MTTDLTKYANAAQLPTDAEAMADALGGMVNDQTSGGGDGGDVDYASFSGKKGSYAVGREGTDLDPDDLFIIGGPNALFEGWIFWKNNKVLKRHEWPVTERSTKAIAEADLEFVAETTRSQDGWSSQVGFLALPVDSERLKPLQFATNSKSGRNAVGDLVQEMRTRLLAGEPCYPILGFDKETFEAQGETNYKPKFVVEAWVTDSAAMAWLNGNLDADDLIAGEEPAKLEPVVDPEEPKTTRKKSRRKAA